MSDIDFQNGLVVGMTLAGKNGLVGDAFVTGPRIVSAENIDFVTTQIQFDRNIQSFDTDVALDWFCILSEVYWVLTQFTVAGIEIVSSKVIRITHSDISNVDGIVMVFYNENKGNLRSESGSEMQTDIFFYMPTLSETELRIRLRSKIGASKFPSGIVVGALGYSENLDASIQEEDENITSDELIFNNMSPGSITISLFGITETYDLDI